MAAFKPTFDIFGPTPEWKNIKVGYISTDRGYVEGMNICDANIHAKKNPGSVFVYKPKRDRVQFLNINQVNDLKNSPNTANQDAACPDGLDMEAPASPVRVVFMGGGGVGVAANPIIGDDGAVLAVHMVDKGFGYRYPPIVEVRDDSHIGAGAVTHALLGEQEKQMIYYDDKEDFEEYEICPSPFTSGLSDGGVDSKDRTKRSEYGRRWGPDGKDLGKWVPQAYTDDTIPFSQVVDDYIKKVQEVAGKEWFTTRKNPPLRITSAGEGNIVKYNVDSPMWGDVSTSFMNKFAISPKPKSNTKGSDFAGRWYTFEWDLTFPYDGDYILRGGCDNLGKVYFDNQLVHGWDVNLDNNFKGNPTKIKKTIKKGGHTLRLDLFNKPEMMDVIVQQPPPPSTRNILFKITSGSMFANGVRIEDLDINEVKPFTPPNMGKKGQLNVSHTRKIEYGKKYKVVFSSKSEAKEGEGKGYSIKYSGLKKPGDRRWVSDKRLEFDDNSEDGFDVNGSFTIDSGDAKFAQDGVKLIGSGLVTLTYSWNDRPGYKSKALETIKIAKRTWTQLNVRRGSETHTIDLGPKVGSSTGANTSNIQLRTKGSNVIQMEDHTDNDWTDIIVNASGGQFTDLKGNIAYFSVPHPLTGTKKATGKSTQSKGQQTREVFNTVDYINKANRQLWRTNVYSRGGFLNDYGVCPFDTKIRVKDNPYAGNHEIVWSNVNFPISGNYSIEVAVDDNVDIKIGDQVTLSKKGFVGDTAVGSGTLKTTKFIKEGTYNITADLFQKSGGDFAFKKPDGKEVQMSEVNFKVTSAAGFGNRITIPGLFSVSKDLDGSQINQTFSRQIEAEKEYDVILTTVRNNDRGETGENVKLRTKDGGRKLEMEEWTDDDWGDIRCVVDRGEFYNIHGNRCKFRLARTIKGINPMALAINIKTEFTEKQVQAPKSWNENPMGVAMTIEAPLPPVPQEPIPLQEGRCPNNPFWTTRFPGARDKTRWHPVRKGTETWGDLLNRYGISPLPPLDEDTNPSNDEGSFSNIWTKNFPYGGYYKAKLEADDFGQLWIDDQKILDYPKDARGGGTAEKLIYISGGKDVSHDIKVVVENKKSERKKQINTQVFNTMDWIGGGFNKPKHEKINFRITSAAEFANGIKIPDLGIDSNKRYKGPQLNEKFVRDVEVNKVYEVEVTSTQSREGVKLRTKGESVLEMEEHSDNDWKDIVCAATKGRFYDFKPGANKATCKFIVTAPTTVSGGLGGGAKKEGVSYQGPHLFHYNDKRWGKVMNNDSVSPISTPTQSLSDPNENILGTKVLLWKDVNFPQTGTYDITFVADNNAKLFIDDKEYLKAPDNYKMNEYITTPIEIKKGKHNIRIELFNAHHQYSETVRQNDKIFLSNPTGVALRIYTKMVVGAGTFKPWSVNPVGVAAKLIPPPCPKEIKGKGIIPAVVVDDPGNGYKKPAGPGYPVALVVKNVTPVGNPINYNCKKDTASLSNGAKLKLNCGPFGIISSIDVLDPGAPVTRMPELSVDSDTGVNLDVRIDFEVQIVPPDIEDIIQVTDLVGLKQTGYYKGKPYYGAVFYENGIKYSGWYRTAGELVQIYDTMQESITAQVTTPPSAIRRQGSDTSSNDPGLNLPGTPQNLT